MSTISRVTTWSDGQTLTAAALNGEFNNILNDYNGGITDANISNSAAISPSKINATFPSGAIVGTTDSQTLTNKTLTSPTINGGTIASATINTPTFSAGAINTADINDAAVTSRKMKLDQIQTATSTTDLATTSTSYVDYTGLSVTFTPNVASNFLVLFNCTFYGSQAAGGQHYFSVLLDGTIKGNDPLVTGVQQDNLTGNYDISVSGFVWMTGVSQASHTVKVQAKCGASSGTLHTRFGSLIVIPFAS